MESDIWAFGRCYTELDDVYCELQKHCGIGTILESIQLEIIEPDKDMGRSTGVLSVANGCPSERKVKIGLLANHMLWHLCWFGKQIWDGKTDKVDITDLLHRLHAIDRCNEDLAKLHSRDLYAWDSQDLSIIFAYATNFIIYHEIGHIVMKHNPLDKSYDIKPLSELKTFEVDADKYSMESIQVVSKNLGQKDLAYIGIICAQCLMFFIRKKDVDYEHDAHGDPMERIHRKLSAMNCELQPYKCIVDEMKKLAVRFLLEKYGE